MIMDPKELDTTKMQAALRDLLLEASEDELREALDGADASLEELAHQGRAAAQAALASRNEDSGLEDLHRGLGALVQMLRRDHQLTIEQLARLARVDPSELRRIELDPGFDASPRC
jgi:hypothetical protein